MGLHKGADGFMSEKQFTTFYWPFLKRIVQAYFDEGFVPCLFAEGDYNSRLDIVKELPKGQGGFVALATACFLYERYAIAALQAQGKEADRPQLLRQLARDFGVDEPTANAFCQVVRNGILHQGMPLQKSHGEALPKWAFLHSYPLMALESIGGEPFLKVQPGRFMDRVLELWEGNFDLLRSSGSFPWATVGPVPA